MKETNESKGIFINGKNQVVQMLRFMSPKERKVLIDNIRLRNPNLASELLQQSISFENLGTLSNFEIERLFSMITAPILGMSIRTESEELQRKILSLAPRTYAEEAFYYLTLEIANQSDTVKRAQRKVVEAMTDLKRA